MKTSELCRQHGISEQTLYRWKTKYGGLEVSDAKKLKQLEDMTEHQPIKQHAQRGQVLFDRGRGNFALQLFQERSDMEWLHLGELVNALPVAPGRKPPRGVEVRLARVVVVDLRGEEFYNAPSCFGVGANSAIGAG